MTTEIVLGAVSGLTALVSAVASIRQRIERRDEGTIAQQFKLEPEPEMAIDSDPRALNKYLFMHVGKLPVREFAADTEIRNVVGRAVSRIDDLLESPNQELEEDTGKPSGPAHLIAAERAIRNDDPVGALARLRLWIELELQQLAEMADAPIRQQGGPSRAIRPLAKLGLITPHEASVLSSAVRLANGAVHGEPVLQSDAADAIQSTAKAMSDIGKRLPEWPAMRR